MKNWEDMKDFSYVGIKLTKAKTISEGLTKCKIQKLTRQNPVYEHLKFHQLLSGKKECHLCVSFTSVPKTTPEAKQRVKNSGKSSIDLHRKVKTEVLNQSSPPTMRKKTMKNHYTSLNKLNELLGDNLQVQAFKKFDRFKQVIEKFDDTVRRTKSQFFKMKDYSRNIQEHFLTEVDEINQDIDEDRTLVVAKVQSQRMNMIQQYEKQKKRQKNVEKQIKEMNKPIKFPLNEQQIVAIVNHSRQKQFGETAKLNRVLHSLYEYKAKANYASKMKVVKQYTNK